MQTSQTAVPGCAVMDGNHRDTDGHTPTHAQVPVQDPNGNGRRCCKMKAPSLVASWVRTQSPLQAWNWLPLTPTTTKYHLNLNVNNVSRHPHIRSSPVLGLRRLSKCPPPWTGLCCGLECLSCPIWLEHVLSSGPMIYPLFFSIFDLCYLY